MPSTPTRPRSPAGPRRPGRGSTAGVTVVVVLCVAATSYSVLQSLVVPALGTFQRQLGTTASGAAWLLTAYLLSASVLTPVIGRLGDLFGKRRALVWSLVALSAGAALSAVAQDLP